MILRRIKHIISSKKSKQSLVLIGTSLVNLVFSFYINMLLARILGKVDYGNFSFILNIFTFSQVFFVFGFFHSGSRLLAVSDDKDIPKIYTAELIISVFLYLLMAISILFFSIVSKSVSENDLLLKIITILPLAWVFILINYFEILLPGNNDIKLLAKSRMFPRVILVVVVSIFYFLKFNGLTSILISYFTSYAISFLLILNNIPKSKANVVYFIKKIFTNNKNFGFKIYIGSVLSVGASQLSGLFISHYAPTNVEVGFFNIASQLSLPLTLIPSILGTVFFRDFARMNKIPINLFVLVLIISIIVLIFINLLSPFLIRFFYGNDYSSSIGIINSLTYGAMLYGISDFFSKFLLAKGRGDELLKISIIVGAVLIISNILFIKFFLGLGAAYARIVSGVFFCLFSAYYYLQYIKHQYSPILKEK